MTLEEWEVNDNKWLLRWWIKMEIFVESLKDDYIKVGKYRIRPFSILWWACAS